MLIGVRVEVLFLWWRSFLCVWVSLARVCLVRIAEMAVVRAEAVSGVVRLRAQKPEALWLVASRG